MKPSYKIVLLCLSIIVLLFVTPFIIFQTATADSAMGLIFLLFFVLYPIASIVYGILSGFDIKRLWCLPLAFATLFPPLYSITIKEMVWDLYVYSAIYFILGYVATLVTALINFTRKRDKNERD